MTAAGISTDRQIAGLKPGDKPYEVAVEKCRGLRVRVFPTGARHFEYRYMTDAGTRRRHRLGPYPGLSLADARAAAAALAVGVTAGQDPAGERAAARERARTGDTLSELAESFWKASAKGLHGGRKRPKRQITIEKEQQWWRCHIEPALGRRRIEELKRADIKVFMRELATDSGLAPASIGGIGSLLQAVLGFAVDEERIDANPATGLARPLALTSRDRLFNDHALSVLWSAASVASQPRQPGERSADIHARLLPEMGLAIRLLMLTLSRRNEIAGARWKEFDLNAGQWTIPSERAKAKHIHIVPLTPEMLEVLKVARNLHPRSEMVFPAMKGEGEHLDPHALTRAFSRICKRNKLESGSPHDIRRSGATTLVSRYGVSRLVVGMLLGHTAREGAAVTSIYDRHTYMPEKRRALEDWSRHLANLGASSPFADPPTIISERLPMVDNIANPVDRDQILAQASRDPEFRKALIEGLLYASVQ